MAMGKYSERLEREVMAGSWCVDTNEQSRTPMDVVT